ncbi:FAD-binding protein [uncultured Sutterella sp.]|uniref:FAD-binding protein n=1 Tax=uncultured Sutterella sp. TaxID=286133 RepID=UPI00261D6E5F|nr:FAD-binding protein [uncultured Sutterella sp.]
MKMKPAIAAIAISAAFAAAAVSAAPADGAYRGESMGRNGPVTVEVTLKAGSIAKVDVVSHKESVGISDPAIERIPAAIVENQTAKVDVISGATLTSNAIINAVVAALKNAGADISQFTKPVGHQSLAGSPVKEVDSEILVIGAGNGGITAAVKAALAGKKVILMEKRAAVGGVSALNHGGLAATGTRYQREVMKEKNDSAELLYKDMLVGGDNRNDKVLARMAAERVGEVGNWLIDDLKIEYGAAWVKFPGHSAARQISAKGNSLHWQEQMLDIYKKHGGVIMTDVRAQEFVTDKDGSVIGVRATGVNDQPYEFKAKSFILASGGYGADHEMVPEIAKHALFYGIPTETGDGFKMARKIGADQINMDCITVYPNGLEVQPGRSMDTTGSSTLAVRNSAIYVNSDGKRVINENSSLNALARATMSQKDYTLYLVLDNAAWQIYQQKAIDDHTVTSKDIFESWKSIRNNGKPIICEGTIEHCSKEMGINAAGVEASIARWNEFVKAGKDADFGRTTLKAIGEGPYHIIEQKGRYQTTLGGLKADADMRILNTAGKPIGNLYGAGSVVGGANGADALTTMKNTWVIVSGYVAAESAIENLKK